MFIQKIEISGFKSFANKTILDFSGNKKLQNEVTCVVGPNGSGKSNISDALRWVIGEKSSKNLRGTKKEDVIFSGSSSKPKMGCAKVSVFFDNSKRFFDLDYKQVIITRKVYRDGEGSYYVNNNKVRLLDLVEILSEAGINHNNHTIINQGMTDQILLSSPAERMGFLEDAAGVKEFQIKKNQSLKRIKKTELNLEKIASLMREIEPELRVLKTQARKIENSQKDRDKLFKKRAELFAVKLRKIENNKNQNQTELARIKKQLELSRSKIKDLENKLAGSDKTSLANQDQKTEKIRKEKIKLEDRFKELEKVAFRKEIEIKSLLEKIENLDQVEVILVDQKYIVTYLGLIKNELNKQLGKKLDDKIICKIDKLLKEIQAGKVTKSKIDTEKKEQKTILENKLSDLKQAIQKNSLKIEKCEQEIKEKKSEIEKNNQEKIKKQEERLEFSDKLRREQFEIEKAEKYQQHLKIERDRWEGNFLEIKKDILENSQFKIKDLELIKTDRSEDDLKMEIEKLNWRLEQVEEIDVSVIAEFKELGEKYDFLKRESKDLRLTLEELKKIVSKMEKTIKQKMKEAFSAINKEFSNYFKLLFNGGRASLEKIKFERSKTLDEEPSFAEATEGKEEKEVDYGLEIKVNPPGKRINSLNMLSGGERTLTSIALLFALIAYNPPPFAFLDEIEANLDDANAENFSRILKKLANQTQFILATHSQEVMRQANILYGITMNKKEGYSKIFSLRLEQVKKMIKF